MKYMETETGSITLTVVAMYADNHFVLRTHSLFNRCHVVVNGGDEKGNFRTTRADLRFSFQLDVLKRLVKPAAKDPHMRNGFRDGHIHHIQ